jgi:hypothetical protein
MRRVTLMVAAMVMVSVLAVGSVAFAANPQVEVCHNGHTITVSEPAVALHDLRHGDLLGPCVQPEPA